jgi:hypothetical protein
MEKETIEEFALRNSKYTNHSNINTQKQEAIILGAKWQAEKMYSEEDMKQFAEWLIKVNFNYTSNISDVFLIWEKQYKKK